MRARPDAGAGVLSAADGLGGFFPRLVRARVKSARHGPRRDITTTVDLYGKRVASVDAALADAVGGAIFAAPTVVPLRLAK